MQKSQNYTIRSKRKLTRKNEQRAIGLWDTTQQSNICMIRFLQKSKKKQKKYWKTQQSKLPNLRENINQHIKEVHIHIQTHHSQMRKKQDNNIYHVQLILNRNTMKIRGEKTVRIIFIALKGKDHKPGILYALNSPPEMDKLRYSYIKPERIHYQQNCPKKEILKK